MVRPTLPDVTGVTGTTCGKTVDPGEGFVREEPSAVAAAAVPTPATAPSAAPVAAPSAASADPAGMRVGYHAGTLDVADLAPTWVAQFRAWFGEAVAAGVAEPNAMVLATAAPDGVPSARTVLLKGVDDNGFSFFTNLSSRKGRELAANPHASLVFPWIEVFRQVVVVGRAHPMPRPEVAAYFATRPYGSQIGAWASHQSAVIPDRAVLVERRDALRARYPEHVPVPDFWGGFLVVPDSVEFWQGRPDRLHDRLRYRVDGGRTVVERLAP